MIYPFDVRRGQDLVLRLALDTGTTGTMINVAPATVIGYDSSLAPTVFWTMMVTST